MAGTRHGASFAVFVVSVLLCAPIALAQPYIATLNADITRALSLPDVRDRLASEGAEIVPGTPAAFASFIQTEIARVRKLSKSTPIELD